MVDQRDTVFDGFVDVPYVPTVENCTADCGTKFGNARLTQVEQGYRACCKSLCTGRHVNMA